MSFEDDTPRPDTVSETAETPDSARIAELNDQLRIHRTGGEIKLTSGVRALGEAAIAAILVKLTVFSFTPGNDPYGERDFGIVEYEGETINWKIEYYDKSKQYLSPDPSDPSVTTRVLFIMLREEN